MEKLVEKGLVKNIGMSNFNSKQLTDLMDECKVLPAVLQASLMVTMLVMIAFGKDDDDYYDDYNDD